MRKTAIIALVPALALAAGAAQAETAQTGPFTYEIDEGVDFAIGNIGSGDFTFNWSDASGTFTGVVDPTFVFTVGQTYTFNRTSGSHPLGICDDTLEVSGTDGSYLRVSSDITVLNNANLTPIADFVADPGPTSDTITWTLTDDDIGTYWYICRVTGHRGMTGRIEVVGVPTPVCVGDVTTTNTNPGDNAYGQPDGNADGADLSYFVEFWLAGDLGVADVQTTNTNPGDAAYGEPDGAVDGADLSYFVEQWLAGCL